LRLPFAPQKVLISLATEGSLTGWVADWGRHWFTCPFRLRPFSILNFPEDDMTQLQTAGARLYAIGRCALVGMLVGMLATQAVAEGATAVTPKIPVKPETTSIPSGSETEQISLATTANLQLAAQDGATVDVNALPDAPTAPAGTSESASLAMPPELKAMMDDASQNAQNVQPAPAAKSHGVQRPGMLIMGIVGIPVAMLGIGLLQIDAGKNAGLKDGLGATFLAGGAAMSGFGFYLAFHKKNH
jgi:hypothetical protein